jgi:ABC-type multidrug transport system ATPase subunit
MNNVPYLMIPRPEEHREEGYSITWSDLTYSVEVEGKSKSILSNINGYLEPGDFLAIIGSSGAGKSTMLDVLSGRKTPKDQNGYIAVNGTKWPKMKHISRYCFQTDALYGWLTVRENLYYAAKFNLSQTVSESEIDDIVAQSIHDFGLASVADTIIGNSIKRGCSGGQIRRCSVACQTIGLKSGILFLDEPTSGLDSVGAYSVINIIKKNAQRNKTTTIATIHQPNSETFNLFTHLVILAKGKVIYFGNRERAIDYFESTGHQMPTFENPADVYLRMTNIDYYVGPDSATLQSIDSMAKSYRDSKMFQWIKYKINKIESSTHASAIKTSFENGAVYQTMVLSKRTFRNAVKNPIVYWVRVALYLLLGLMVGSFWFQMGFDQSNSSDRNGSLFFSVAFLATMSMAGIPAVLEDQNVFDQELSNGFYGIESYLFSNFITSIPFFIITSTSFCAVTYLMCGYQHYVWKFMVYNFFVFLVLLISEAQVVLVAVCIPVFVIALAICALSNGLWMVAHGVGFTRFADINIFWKSTFFYLNFIHYAVDGMVKNELDGLVFNCAPVSQGCVCQFPSELNSACQFRGEDHIIDRSVEINYFTCVWSLCVILVVLKAVTFVVLKFKHRNCH